MRDRRIMNTRKITVVAALAVATTTFGAGPVEAASDELSGVVVWDLSRTKCTNHDYLDVYTSPPAVFTGSLQGCLYGKIDAFKENGPPSGVYLEQGHEVFVGSLNGGTPGTFATTYKFE